MLITETDGRKAHIDIRFDPAPPRTRRDTNGRIAASSARFGRVPPA
jgi:hypothetical protein